MTTHTPAVADAENQLAQSAYESIRSINHLTVGGKAIPAPELYAMLGNLKCLGHALDQTLRQLAHCLGSSLNVYAVYEDDGGNPEESAAYAMDSMREAAFHAEKLGMLLEGAQDDISRQGVYTAKGGR
ncbi:hypothetical protein [Intrasporangium calvum]|uniref:hypothetical protein n=1 Tax=Intrasporangium calvum TaxID=53358 RepID=UPI000DF60926|nr:hypothetical protein [Intrasporangium calvum]AXG14954.1 hypothetical protein DN585_17460 [Intrasporangium calvum]